MKYTRLLVYRLLAGIFVVTVVGVGLLTFLIVDIQTERYTNLSTASAQRLSDIVKRSTQHSMLLNHREDIYRIIQTIGSEPGIEAIRIYNKKGEVSYSTVEKEVNTTVDMDAEACVGCHLSGQSSVVTPANEELVRTYTNPAGHSVIGVITPIKNQKSCSEADCHVHPPEQTILGVLDVMLTLDETERYIEDLRKTQYAGGVALLLLLTGFCGVFLWRTVNIPVQRLTEGTIAVMNGDLDHSINVQTKDEIGFLTKSFNHMTVTLKRTQEELQLLNQTLEERVQKKTEELGRAQKNLIQVEKMVSLGTLAATVAHELNNPLEGILTYAKLIRKRLNASGGTLSDEQRKEVVEELSMIADETARCGNIVKNLLLFSRRKVGEFKRNDLRGLVEQSAKLVEHHLKMHNIARQMELSDGLPEVECDGEQIQQMLLALQINAVEAMQNEGTLTITLRRISEGVVMLTVGDTGVGIRPEDLPHVFEPFYTTKKEGKGTGLGLAVVYGIVERHHGTITVDSAPNKGTTFTIHLPIDRT
ncbi:MAG: HAMP domain-containing protein [Bacteroidetes bacterium]|nr:HAMP domain-containing protein [Bacteroidota bacterium]